jgi:hypothetical protein
MINNLLQEELKQTNLFGDAVTRDLLRAAAERIKELEGETPKRIEMVALLNELSEGNESPGETMLRALLFLQSALRNTPETSSVAKMPRMDNR